jgi:hypothetical protein
MAPERVSGSYSSAASKGGGKRNVASGVSIWRPRKKYFFRRSARLIGRSWQSRRSSVRGQDRLSLAAPLRSLPALAIDLLKAIDVPLTTAS